MNRKYSGWSVLLSVVSAVAIFLSYSLAPREPEGLLKILIQVSFFSAIISGLLSLIFSFLAMRKKEEGFLKFLAPLLVVLIFLVFLVTFALTVYSFF